MRRQVLRWVASAAIGLAVLSTTGTAATDEATVQRVLFKDGKALVVKDGAPTELTEELNLPNGIKVLTNGTFTVKGGKERPFKEGQILGADGMLASLDGSLVPVFDHVTMQRGRPMLVQDGESAPLIQEKVLGDGSRVSSDGYLTTKEGRRVRLLDGQLLKLEGGAIPAKDTIVLRNGQVTVQKDGSLLKLTPGRSLMMNDGTKVFGDGRVVMKDGSIRKLAEGEMLTIEGLVRKDF